jgi:RNA polymerase sigma-70 factor (ECF subfamily)
MLGHSSTGDAHRALGEERAYQLLSAKYHRKLTRLLTRFVHEPAELDEVVQEALATAYQALPDYADDIAAFDMSLYRTGIAIAKKRAAAGGHVVRVCDDHEDAAVAEGGEQRCAATLQSALASLPPELRSAITLRAIHGLGYEEIARNMRCPVETARARVLEARELISERASCLSGRA